MFSMLRFTLLASIRHIINGGVKLGRCALLADRVVWRVSLHDPNRSLQLAQPSARPHYGEGDRVLGAEHQIVHSKDCRRRGGPVRGCPFHRRGLCSPDQGGHGALQYFNSLFVHCLADTVILQSDTVLVSKKWIRHSRFGLCQAEQCQIEHVGYGSGNASFTIGKFKCTKRVIRDWPAFLIISLTRVCSGLLSGGYFIARSVRLSVRHDPFHPDHCPPAERAWIRILSKWVSSAPVGDERVRSRLLHHFSSSKAGGASTISKAGSVGTLPGQARFRLYSTQR